MVVQNTQIVTQIDTQIALSNVFTATKKKTPFKYVEQKQPMEVGTKEYPIANVWSILPKQLMVTKKMKYLIFIPSMKEKSSHSLSH